jgi:uroporphyrinogen-III synthase
MLQHCRMHASRLDGKRILLTRAERQLDELSRSVRKLGGLPVRFPCLAVQRLDEEIEQALAQLADCSDVAFTSANGVQCVAAAAHDPAAMLQSKRIAAVGEKTAAALRRVGIRADITPELPSQDGLLRAYVRHGLPRRLMFFRAREGRDALIRGLQELGVDVILAPAYQTVCPDDDAEEIIRALRQAEIDAVLLGSSKAARFFVQRVGDIRLARRPLAAAISDQVAKAAGDAGLNVQIVATTASFDAMLNDLAEFYAASRMRSA